MHVGQLLTLSPTNILEKKMQVDFLARAHTKQIQNMLNYSNLIRWCPCKEKEVICKSQVRNFGSPSSNFNKFSKFIINNNTNEIEETLNTQHKKIWGYRITLPHSPPLDGVKSSSTSPFQSKLILEVVIQYQIKLTKLSEQQCQLESP